MEPSNPIHEIAQHYLEKYAGTDLEAIELSYLMSAATTAMRAASERLFTSFGSDHRRNRFGVVRVLFFSETQEMSQTEISDSLGFPASTITYFIDALERDGLVARKPHPADRRMTLVELTEQGRTLCQELVPAVALHMRNVASVFTLEEKRLFNSLLLRFKAAAESSLSE